MKNRQILFILGLILLIGSCSKSGSIISHNDTRYFKESPKIVTKDNRYFLRWQYSDNTKANLFYMMSSSEIINDTLQFSIPVSSSSGSLNGKVQFEEVTSITKIKKLKENKVVWKNPNGTVISLKIEPLTFADETLLMEMWKTYNSKSTF